MFRKHVIAIFILSLVLLAVLPAPALAHRMLIRPVESGLIRVVFDDNTVAAGAEVVVYDQEDEVIHQGKTDDEGYFTYELNLPVEKFVVSDGLGHRAEWIYGTEPKEELPLPLRIALGISVLAFLGAFFQYRSKTKTA